MRGNPDTEQHDLKGNAKRERRLAKKLLIIIGGFIVLISLGILFWNWSAAREWQRFKSDLEAKGETFELQRLLPSAPADDLNYGAIAPLKEIALVIDDDPETGEPATRRAAFPNITLKYDSSNREKLSLQSGVERGIAANLTLVADEYRKAGSLKMPANPGQSAADILAGIDATTPSIASLCKDWNRPESQFTPVLVKRTWFKPLISQKVPHFNAIQNAAKSLQLRAVAAAQAKDGRTAAESLLAMSKLARGMSQEPGLVAHLVFLTVTSMTHAALWEGLNQRVFSNEQLRDLQSSLGRYDGRDTLLYALRTEMLAYVEAIYDLKSSRRKPDFSGINGETAIIVGMAPSGWFDQNAVHLVFHEWTYYIEPLKTSGLRAAAIKADSLTPLLGAADPPRIAYLVADMLLGSERSVIYRATLEQSRRDLACVAVALEQFFAAHHVYPTSLAELTPSILASPPIDLVSGQTVRYRPTADGRYLLWVPGFDGIDDGGKVSVDPKTRDIRSSVRRPDYRGDWVWQYTPVKA